MLNSRFANGRNPPLTRRVGRSHCPLGSYVGAAHGLARVVHCFETEVVRQPCYGWGRGK